MIAQAARNGNISIVQYLVNLDLTKDLQRALKDASSNGHIEIIKYLISQGADIHAYNEEAICCAICWCNFETIKFLIEIGADYHRHKAFALRMAVRHLNKDMAEYFIERGVNTVVIYDLLELPDSHFVYPITQEVYDYFTYLGCKIPLKAIVCEKKISNFNLKIFF